MNNTVIEFTKAEILEGLNELPDDWQLKFKRMYSHDNLDAPMKDVVDNMPHEKLDWALTQVQNSLKAKELKG